MKQAVLLSKSTNLRNKNNIKIKKAKNKNSQITENIYKKVWKKIYINQ